MADGYDNHFPKAGRILTNYIEENYYPTFWVCFAYTISLQMREKVEATGAMRHVPLFLYTWNFAFIIIIDF